MVENVIGRFTLPMGVALNFKINDKLRYIPGHCCTTVNMFNEIYLVDGDEVVAKWDITSRGKAQ